MRDILGIFSDIHLKPGNIPEVTASIQEAIQVCRKRGITHMFCLGDVFESRISQRQEVLAAWDNILDIFEYNKMVLHVLRGNHDSTDYKISESFLKPYRHHPSCDLIDDIGIRNIEGMTFYCIAFYEDFIWMERYNELIKKGVEKGSLLFSHIAVQGSINNDGTKVSCSLKPSLFKPFKRVYLGHYHDYQEIPPNIFHLGSLQQNDFGEDEDKGIWILDDDGRVELVHLKNGAKFKKLVVDLDSLDHKQAVSVIKKFEKENSGYRLRVELTGDTASIKAFDGEDFKSNGIDIKKKYKEVEAGDEEVGEVRTASFEDIREKFEVFCKENDYDYKEGFTILKKAFDGSKH